jgi:hypothetical protein
MWSIIIIMHLACGVSVNEIAQFQSKDSCEAAVVNVRAAFIAQNPVVMCLQK